MVFNVELIKRLEEEAEELQKRTEQRKKMIEEEQNLNNKELKNLEKIKELINLMKDEKKEEDEPKKEIKKERKRRETKEERKKKETLKEIKEDLKEIYKNEPEKIKDKIFFKEDAEDLEELNEGRQMKKYLKKSSIIAIIDGINCDLLSSYEISNLKNNVIYEYEKDAEDCASYELRKILNKYNLELLFYSTTWGYIRYKNEREETTEESEEESN